MAGSQLQRRSVVLAGIVAVIAAILLVGLELTSAVARGQAGARCTHGASSIGPVFVRDGRIVGGDTTPHTDACLP